MSNKILFFLSIILFGILSCKKTDTIAPILELNPDMSSPHFRNSPYADAGAIAYDNYSCNLNNTITVINHVNTQQYGSYSVTYTATDKTGNQSSSIRNIDIILPKDDYYSLFYAATDVCSLTGTFTYTGILQDCGCNGNYILAQNLSNLGASALFPMQLSGIYNESILLDTIKSDVHFIGNATMSKQADTLTWEFSISDSIQTENCTSTWIKID